MLKDPILFAIAIDTDEKASPIMACTWADFVHGSSKAVIFSFISAIAILMPNTSEPHVS